MAIVGAVDQSFLDWDDSSSSAAYSSDSPSGDRRSRTSSAKSSLGEVWDISSLVANPLAPPQTVVVRLPTPSVIPLAPGATPAALLDDASSPLRRTVSYRKKPVSFDDDKDDPFAPCPSSPASSVEGTNTLVSASAVVKSQQSFSTQPLPLLRPIKFHQTRIPDGAALKIAMSCRVIDDWGFSTSFGDLIDRQHKTVAIFIRHFWCGYCQTYIEKLVKIANNDVAWKRLEAARLKIIIIGNGHPGMVSKYRSVLKCPFPIYTDPTPTNDLFRAMGMSKRTTKPGPASQKGDYLARVSKAQGVIKGAITGAKLPLFLSPGDNKQLGGEFVFEPLRRRAIQRKAPRPLTPRTLGLLGHAESPRSDVPPSPVSMISTTSSMRSIARPSNYPLLPPSSKLGEERKKREDPKRATPLPLVPRTASIAPAKRGRATSEPPTSLRGEPEGSSEGLMVGKVNGKVEQSVLVQCRFAHRMSTTRNHASLRDLFQSAGVALPSSL